MGYNVTVDRRGSTRISANRLTWTVVGEAAMPAYWIARARIFDPVEYKKYTDRVPPIMAKYGGRILARGGRYQINEGPADFSRFVLIEFDSLEQGVACFNSPEYEVAASFRRNGGGEVQNVVVEGLAPGEVEAGQGELTRETREP